MLRYALRRMLWAVPTLFGISLVVFFLTTLIPDPLEPAGAASEAVEEQRRARFLDLPRFFNAAPSDVRTKAEDLIGHVVDGEPEAARKLARLGGAALPHVLPKLEGLAPEERTRVALALVPVAERMGLVTPEKPMKPEDAVVFWTRFWEDRELDFTAPSVRRAVGRLVEHGSAQREKELLVVDTFALEEVVLAMKTTQNRVALGRLARIASHVTGRDVLIKHDASEREVRHAIASWEEWWFVHRTDYVTLDGAGRATATLGETRYGKWITRIASGQLGLSVRDGEAVSEKLWRHAPITLLITGLAMLLSYALAVPIGVLSAWRRGRTIDTTTAVALFALYSLPTFWTAELLHRIFHGSGALVLPTLSLTLASLAILSRYQRTSVLDVIRQDYVRTARAKGVAGARLFLVHVLRNALLPTVTLAGLQLPALLGGAFVVEEVFGIPGIGYETLRAVEAHDATWLMATIVLSAIVTTVGLIASDVAYGILDPRVREAMTRPRGVPA